MAGLSVYYGLPYAARLSRLEPAVGVGYEKFPRPYDGGYPGYNISFRYRNPVIGEEGEGQVRACYWHERIRAGNFWRGIPPYSVIGGPVSIHAHSYHP